MSEPIIQLRGYTFQYRAQAKPTLKDINLTIREGEKILIVGPSGSGKSTLGSCINGLIPFSYPGEITGRLTVAGQEAAAESLFTLSATTGTVLQDPDGQFIGLTAGEDIAFSLENECVESGQMHTLVREAAALVGIDSHLESAPHALSGGQKQRVGLAGVMVNKVRVLLFDEPLANLDPATGKQAIDLIDKIQKQTNTTVIIIEHRLEDVLYRPVDRVILMEEGRVLADLPPDELLCSGLLRKSGIREPLCLCALDYAGVELTPKKHPAALEDMALDEADREKVRGWFQSVEMPPPPLSPEVLLEVEGLTFAYESGHRVLEEISFSIRRGECVSIVGTNGAGKSTLAKLICGFIRPESGTVRMLDRDLSGDTIAERARHIGYVMQNPNQMISKTMIYEEVALGLRSLRLSPEEERERVEATLRICGLYPMRNWPIAALSFGQKKRVTIASILVLRPEIIILDEPTAGQDFRHYTEIMEFVRELGDQGVTVLMITHDMHLMLEYAPRALVFHSGRLIADTSSAAVLTDPTLTERASLKETSLYGLAERCGIPDGTEFVRRFIHYDRERHGSKGEV